jgi:hypothetical protein
MERGRKEFATFAPKHARNNANDVRLLKKQRIDPGGVRDGAEEPQSA